MFAPSSTIGKNMIFWCKIVIFHTKYPHKFFKCAPPNLKSWIRPCIGTVKRSLKIPRGQSEAVNRRTDNTMPKVKGQKDKQRYNKHYTEN